MKKSFGKWIKKIFFPALIILITGALAWANYEPGTFLSGWDTLHPEFNLPLYLKRTFFGAWQEHQGLGAPASQAHAAELPRLLIVYLLSLALPLSAVRYAFFFLTLGVGALGTYFFAKYVLAYAGLPAQAGKFAARYPASFLAALFYLLNLSTLAHFYVPLEMFAVHFASLPWLLFLAARFLDKGSKKHLFWFTIATIFAASMAHTATLFYVYFAALTLFVSLLFLWERKWPVLKRGVVILLLTLTLNAYWLLPNIYYIKNHAKEVSQSKIHQIFSNEAFLQSKSFGNLADLSLFKNFLFNWREFDFESGTFIDLMDEWIIHLDKPYVVKVGYVLFAFTLLGVAVSLLRRSKHALALLPLAVVSTFFLLSSTPPFSQAFEYLRENIPLFEEGLRFPFTKFSILFSLTLAIYLSFLISFTIQVLKKVWLAPAFFLAVVAAIFYFSLPAFTGHLISPSMKVKIPSEYFELFNFLQEKNPNARVVKLPLHTFWGWNFYSWDYQGAGFTWFGIPQPTLDREFDRWSPYNESFYNEIAFGLYAKDLDALEQVLEKYQVSYLLLDESILNAGGRPKLLYIDEIKELLGKSGYIRLDTRFGFLTLYKTDFEPPVGGGDKFVWAPDSFARVNANLTYAQTDPVYSKYGTYIQDEEGQSFPFVNFDKRAGLNVYTSGEKIIIENPKADVEVVLDVGESVREDFSLKRGFPEAYNCDLAKKGTVGKINLGDKVIYSAQDGGVSCDFYTYPDLAYSQGYLLRIKGENRVGRSLKIYLHNNTTGRMDLEELLPSPVFDETNFILPKPIDGAGYTLNIETRSYGSVFSENVLRGIEFIPVPIAALMEVELDTKNNSLIGNNIRINRVRKFGTAWYKVDLTGSGLLVLGQGYEEGWLAYLVNGRLPTSKLPHVKVNSWANGWIVPEGEHKIVILYWPQVLQYLGFLILIISLALVVDKGRANRLKYPSSPNLSKF